MKKWTMVMAGLLVTMLVTSNVYAIENIEYQSEELPNDGRIILNFLSMDTDEKSSPVKGVMVEISYIDDNDREIDIRELKELEGTTINLVSDSNGIVIINNLPYGLYKYKVVSIPNGYENSIEENYFGIDLMNKDAKLDIKMVRKIEMAEGGSEYKENQKSEEIKEEEKIIVEMKPQENTEKSIPKNEQVIENVNVDDNTVALKTNINKLSTEIYNYDDSTQVTIASNSLVKQDNIEEDVPKEIIIKNTIAYVRERIKKPEDDMIKKFKEYRISDSIKIAINTVDNTINEYLKFLTDLHDWEDKNKKIKRIDRTLAKVKDMYQQKKYIGPVIKMKIA